MAGPPRPERVYLDSSVWLGWFEDDSGKPAVRRVLEWADTGQIQLLISPLHLVECLGRRPGHPSAGSDPADEIEQILTTGPLTFVEFDVRVALRARQLRLDQVVKPTADAIHLAHAIVARAEVFFTLDLDDFPHGETVQGVYVSEPYVLGDRDLFTQDPG